MSQEISQEPKAEEDSDLQKEHSEVITAVKTDLDKHHEVIILLS